MKADVATESDLPHLVALLGLLFTQEVEFHPDPERQSRGLRMILGSPEVGTVLIRRKGETILGMVVVLITVSTFLGSKAALFEDLIVHPDHRGAGVGSLLLQDALKWATEAGCGRVTLLTDRENHTAIRLYQRHHFAGSTMIPLRRSLSP